MTTSTAPSDAPAPGRLAEVVRLFAKLGVIGFGGPTAHIALMEEETVRRRRWLDHQHFLDSLAVTNMLPGPNSTEMAIHTGYLRAGLPGALLSGLVFILPAFALMLALSWAYFEHGASLRVDSIFYGVKPVVIAVIAATVWRTGRAAVTDWRLAVAFAVGLAFTLALPSWEALVLLTVGLAGVLVYAGPPVFRSLPAIAVLAAAPPLLAWQGDTLVDLTLLFLRTGGLLFGGGFVMIPLIEHDVVERFGWLTREQFLDGVALGQSTPGPIVITATFVGYAAAGLPGAVVATVAIFLPSFVFATASARFVQTVRQWEWARAFLKAVAAAVVGAILAAGIVLARTALTDALTVAVLVVALIALVRFRVDVTYLLVGGGLLGFVVKEAL
ncbi:MAG: chromate efflux transporter [Dehalococcoidia bacterium]